MAKVEVTVVRVTTGTVSASIDDKALKFVNDTATRELDPGTHRLTWTVQGKGCSYVIKVTKPGTIKAGGNSQKISKEIVFGGAKFEVKG